MISCSVNFVSNHKFSDFIIDKIKEEQLERDEELKRRSKRHSLCVPQEFYQKEIEWSVKKRSSLRARTGDPPKPEKLDTFDALSDAGSDGASPLDLITIETTDSYTLTGDPNSLHISLKKSSSLTENNVFRRLEFPHEVDGQPPFMVFQLHGNPSYYLATTQLRHLELQSYCDDTLDPCDPDERFFRCFRSEYGVHILQPHAHKGIYIHHIDNFITTRRFELNLRPPEEYFLHIKTVDPSDIKPALPTTAFDYTRTQTDSSQIEPYSTKLATKAVPDIDKSSLKRKTSKKNKQKDSQALTPKGTSVLSCFRLSLRRKKDKSKR